MLIKCTLGGGVQAPQEVCKFKFCELFRQPAAYFICVHAAIYWTEHRTTNGKQDAVPVVCTSYRAREPECPGNGRQKTVGQHARNPSALTLNLDCFE